MPQTHEAEIQSNFEAFQKVVGGLMTAHAGQFALLRHGTVDGCFKSAGEALIAAHTKFSDGCFSVQEVIEGPLDLGFYSHVASVRADG